MYKESKKICTSVERKNWWVAVYSICPAKSQMVTSLPSRLMLSMSIPIVLVMELKFDVCPGFCMFELSVSVSAGGVCNCSVSEVWGVSGCACESASACASVSECGCGCELE
jgi:hypothetical protein